MSERQAKIIRVKLTAEDYAGFNLYHGRWQLAGLFVFYWCLFVLLALWSGRLEDARNLAFVIPGGLVLSAAMLIFQLWRIRTRTRKVFDNDKGLKLEQEIEWTEAGMRHTTGGTTVNVSWDDVLRAVETSKAIILYMARNKVIMLPKRDVEDLSDVKMTLRRRLPAGKLQLKA